MMKKFAPLAILIAVLLVPLGLLIAQPQFPVTGGSTTGALGAGQLVLGYGTTAASSLRVASVTLTNAQVLALKTAAITIIPAQGTGTLIDVLEGMIIFDYTGAYTESTDNLRLYYRTSLNEPATNLIEMTGFIDATADAIIKFGPVANDQVIQGAELTNVAVVLSIPDADNNFGGGNASNQVTVVVLYRVITTGL